MVISSLSKEYVRVPISASEGGDPVNPTTDTVQMAFPAKGTSPVAGDWKPATWETADGAHFARCLVGPGAVVLTAGVYDVYVKVTDNPEAPVLKAADTLRVT